MTQGLNIEEVPGGVAFDLKVVPGGSRDQIVGLLGAALKVKVSAPPEGGKANAAVCELLAEKVGVAVRDVAVVTGHSRPQKRVRISGISAAMVRERLGM
jgi:hypothetical protein